MKLLNLSRVLLITLFATPCYAGTPANDGTKQYQVDNPADWVELQSIPTLTTDQQSAHGGDTGYLLVDRQIRIDNGSSFYSRVVVTLLNQAGVESNSHINLHFDPHVDTLHIHSVTTKRGNQVIDQLQAGRVEVLRQEDDLANNLVNGQLTLNIIMKDVRVGDVLDYSYTIDHRNPELGNRFFRYFSTSWDDQVARSHVKLLHKDGAPLFIGNHDTSKPATKHAQGWTSMEWTWTNLPAVLSDPDTPSWVEQHSSLEFSQFSGWKDLVQVMLPLYNVADKTSPEIVAITDKIRTTTASKAEQALAIIRFVQEEIRYTGLEFGDGASNPRNPLKFCSAVMETARTRPYWQQRCSTTWVLTHNLH